jgi:hypothetical protein
VIIAKLMHTSDSIHTANRKVITDMMSPVRLRSPEVERSRQRHRQVLPPRRLLPNHLRDLLQ